MDSGRRFLYAAWEFVGETAFVLCTELPTLMTQVTHTLPFCLFLSIWQTHAEPICLLIPDVPSRCQLRAQSRDKTPSHKSIPARLTLALTDLIFWVNRAMQTWLRVRSYDDEQPLIVLSAGSLNLQHAGLHSVCIAFIQSIVISRKPFTEADQRQMNRTFKGLWRIICRFIEHVATFPLHKPAKANKHVSLCQTSRKHKAFAIFMK